MLGGGGVVVVAAGAGCGAKRTREGRLRRKCGVDSIVDRVVDYAPFEKILELLEDSQDMGWMKGLDNDTLLSQYRQVVSLLTFLILRSDRFTSMIV